MKWSTQFLEFLDTYKLQVWDYTVKRLQQDIVTTVAAACIEWRLAVFEKNGCQLLVLRKEKWTTMEWETGQCWWNRWNTKRSKEEEECGARLFFSRCLFVVLRWIRSTWRRPVDTPYALCHWTVFRSDPVVFLFVIAFCLNGQMGKRVSYLLTTVTFEPRAFSSE